MAFLNEESHEELEANEFATNTMVKMAAWTDFTAGGRPTKAEVLAFAAAQDVAPGIVVGRLQHEKIVPFTQMNGLKVPLTWA